MATHETTKGHPVEVVIGAAEDIESRGQQVVDLGASMTVSEEILSDLVSNGSNMRGKAIDSLRESAEEVTSELRLAAELYTAVGPFIRDYGTALIDVQTAMRRIVPDAEELWETYQQKLQALDAARDAPVVYPSGTEPSDDGSARREAEREHQDGITTAEGDANTAYKAWKVEADAYDRQWNTWWDAFDTAATGIETATGDGIEDSIWDNLDGLVEFLQTVISIVSTVLFVISLFVPGLNLVMFALGVAALALTVYQFARGDASGLDLGIAIIGALPFGVIGEAGSFGRVADNAVDAGEMANAASRWPVGRSGDMISNIITGQSSAFWTGLGNVSGSGYQAFFATSATMHTLDLMLFQPLSVGQTLWNLPSTWEQVRWPTF